MSDNAEVSDNVDKSKVVKSNVNEEPRGTGYRIKFGTKFDSGTLERDEYSQSTTELRNAISEIESTRHEYQVDVKQQPYSSNWISNNDDSNQISHATEASGSKTPRDLARWPDRMKSKKRQFGKNYKRFRMKILCFVRGQKSFELDAKDFPKLGENSSRGDVTNAYHSVIDRYNVDLSTSVTLPESVASTSLEVKTLWKNHLRYVQRQKFRTSDEKLTRLPPVEELYKSQNPALVYQAITSEGTPAYPATDFVGPPPLNAVTEENILPVMAYFKSTKEDENSREIIGIVNMPVSIYEPVVAVRNPFIRKIYAILSCQLIVMFWVVYASMKNKSMNSFMKEYGVRMGLSISFIILFLMLCCDLAMVFPLNLGLLAAYTVGVTLIWAAMSCYFSNEIVYLVIGGMAMVAVLQTLMALQTKRDVMKYCIWTVIISLVIYGVVVALMKHKNWVTIRTNYIIYSIAIAFFYSLFLMCITSKVVNEERIKIRSDQCIYGATVIYVDATSIFTHLCCC